MTFRVYDLWLWLWMGCTQTNEVEREYAVVHAEWSDLHQTYQQAVSLYDEKQYPQALAQFRSPHSQYPNSRAVLEGVLLSELHHEEEREVGYARIQEYMLAHPGDVEFRLIQAKFHLQMGEVEKAQADLQLLLFNQSVHPWVLAQDPLLRHYQSKINIDKLPFELIRLLEVDVPTVAVVDDAIDLRISFLHLSSCRPHIPPFEVGLNVQSKKLTAYQETIDGTVVKTTFVQSLTNRSAAKSQSTLVQIHCGLASLDVTIPSVDVIQLTAQPTSPQRSILAFPDLTAVQSADTGVPWTLYINHVEAKKGLWDPPVDG